MAAWQQQLLQPSLNEDAAGAPACLPQQVARAVAVGPARARHGPAARTDVQGGGVALWPHAATAGEGRVSRAVGCIGCMRQSQSL